MSGLVDKDGKPVEKKWEDMDMDERLNVLRIGIGALIQQGNALGAGLQRIIAAMDEMDQAGEPVSTPVPTNGHNCGMAPSVAAEPTEPPFLGPEKVEQTLAQPKMDK